MSICRLGAGSGVAQIPDAGSGGGGGTGTIESINGMLPDAAGNYSLQITGTDGITVTPAPLTSGYSYVIGGGGGGSGSVNSVDGVVPDANGNVQLNALTRTTADLNVSLAWEAVQPYINALPSVICHQVVITVTSAPNVPTQLTLSVNKVDGGGVVALVLSSVVAALDLTLTQINCDCYIMGASLARLSWSAGDAYSNEAQVFLVSCVMSPAIGYQFPVWTFTGAVTAYIDGCNIENGHVYSEQQANVTISGSQTNITKGVGDTVTTIDASNCARIMIDTDQVVANKQTGGEVIINGIPYGVVGGGNVTRTTADVSEGLEWEQVQPYINALPDMICHQVGINLRTVPDPSEQLVIRANKADGGGAILISFAAITEPATQLIIHLTDCDVGVLGGGFSSISVRAWSSSELTHMSSAQARIMNAVCSTGSSVDVCRGTDAVFSSCDFTNTEISVYGASTAMFKGCQTSLSKSISVRECSRVQIDTDQFVPIIESGGEIVINGVPYGSGGGGGGSVSKVDNISPDANGNVALGAVRALSLNGSPNITPDTQGVLSLSGVVGATTANTDVTIDFADLQTYINNLPTVIAHKIEIRFNTFTEPAAQWKLYFKKVDAGGIVILNFTNCTFAGKFEIGKYAGPLSIYKGTFGSMSVGPEESQELPQILIRESTLLGPAVFADLRAYLINCDIHGSIEATNTARIIVDGAANHIDTCSTFATWQSSIVWSGANASHVPYAIYEDSTVTLNGVVHTSQGTLTTAVDGILSDAYGNVSLHASRETTQNMSITVTPATFNEQIATIPQVLRHNVSVFVNDWTTDFNWTPRKTDGGGNITLVFDAGCLIPNVNIGEAGVRMDIGCRSGGEVVSSLSVNGDYGSNQYYIGGSNGGNIFVYSDASDTVTTAFNITINAAKVILTGVHQHTFNGSGSVPPSGDTRELRVTAQWYSYVYVGYSSFGNNWCPDFGNPASRLVSTYMSEVYCQIAMGAYGRLTEEQLVNDRGSSIIADDLLVNVNRALTINGVKRTPSSDNFGNMNLNIVAGTNMAIDQTNTADGHGTTLTLSSTGGGGGGGSVSSVDGVNPDAQGNVQLSIGNTNFTITSQAEFNDAVASLPKQINGTVYFRLVGWTTPFDWTTSRDGSGQYIIEVASDCVIPTMFITHVSPLGLTIRGAGNGYIRDELRISGENTSEGYLDSSQHGNIYIGAYENPLLYADASTSVTNPFLVTVENVSVDIVALWTLSGDHSSVTPPTGDTRAITMRLDQLSKANIGCKVTQYQTYCPDFGNANSRLEVSSGSTANIAVAVGAFGRLTTDKIFCDFGASVNYQSIVGSININGNTINPAESDGQARLNLVAGTNVSLDTSYTANSASIVINANGLVTRTTSDVVQELAMGEALNYINNLPDLICHQVRLNVMSAATGTAYVWDIEKGMGGGWVLIDTTAIETTPVDINLWHVTCDTSFRNTRFSHFLWRGEFGNSSNGSTLYLSGSTTTSGASIVLEGGRAIISGADLSAAKVYAVDHAHVTLINCTTVANVTEVHAEMAATVVADTNQFKVTKSGGGLIFGNGQLM